MQFHLSFFGAAQNVTGSQYLLQANGKNILIDCGLYQEHDLKERNWEDFKFPVESLDAVVLTHAHLDHCGRLPRLVAAGFQGPIYCTRATADIAQIVLQDCAKINEEDAEFKRKRHEKEGRQGPYPEIPLYTLEEANAVPPLFKPCNFNETLTLGEGLTLEFVCVAHILGAAFLRFTITQKDQKRILLFSGDVGRKDMPILEDPSPIGEADYVIVESTYGDRLHGPQANIPNELADIINDTVARRGNLIIPSFAIERTQELIYFLAQLVHENKIPHLRTFIDSPMAVKVSDVFKRHPYLFDQDTVELSRKIRLPGLTMVRTKSDSKTINHINGTAIIIAGAGMCTGGRIKHHLVHHIGNRANTILFVGYQAENTLGRDILDGHKHVRIFGEETAVKAKIAKITGFSAHADKQELCDWLETNQTKPRHVFVTHGEVRAAHAFARLLKQKYGWVATVPKYETVATLR